jgi:hypothetical protein
MSRNTISKEGRLQDYHYDVGKIWRSRNEELEQEVFDRQPPWMDPDEEDRDTLIDLKRLIPKVLETLTNREQKIFWCRFWADLTLDETGAVFDVTRERIRQIEAKAIRRCKHPSRSSDLRSLLDVHPVQILKQKEELEAARKAGEEAAKQATARWEEDWLFRKLLRLQET